MDHIINYEDFKSICRVCMLYCNTNFNKDSVILNMFYKLTDVHFETNDELPQQICPECIDYINEIHAFSLKCRRSHSALIKCLSNYKSKQIKQEPEIEEETNEDIKIKTEITIEEHNIEFIKVEPDIDCETNDPLNVDVNTRTIDLFPPISTEIQAENEEASTEFLNSNDLNIKSSKKKQPSVPEGSSNNEQTRHYKCDQCEKTYIHPYSLKVHKRAHSGERAFECDQCGKSFAESGSLIKHKRLHSGERPYECDLCEKTFTQSSNLRTHLRVHSGERPYKCDQCDKSFTGSGNLTAHKRIHSNANPYKCTQCDKSFKRSTDVTRHERVHSYDYPYKCNQCTKSFVKFWNLKVHKRIHNRGDHEHVN